MTIGPNALALAKAAKGEDTLAVGGAGSQAKIGTDGAVCYGTAALAVELNKARAAPNSGPRWSFSSQGKRFVGPASRVHKPRVGANRKSGTAGTGLSARIVGRVQL